VLIVCPQRIRGLRNGYAQVLTVLQCTRTRDDPSIGVPIEPYHRIAPMLAVSTIRLVVPERLVADGTVKEIAGLVVNHHGGINELHIVIETHSAAIVTSIAVHGATCVGWQFADMKPFEAHDRI